MAPPNRSRRRHSGELSARARGGQPRGVLFFVVVAVGAAADPIGPDGVRAVPGHRLGEPLVEGVARSPAELLADLAGIHGVAPVVTGSVGNMADQLSLIH